MLVNSEEQGKNMVVMDHAIHKVTRWRAKPLPVVFKGLTLPQL